MKALILNSGMGKRMGVLTSEHPKCMTEISASDTILSRQLKLIAESGIQDVVITTGYFDEVLVQYCASLNLPLNIEFVKNPVYDRTNYIYSIYCAKELLKDEDIVLMHGDLVFESCVFDAVLQSEVSCMTVSSTLPLPEKDFKAVIKDGKVVKVGIEFFDDALEAQALYMLHKKDWTVWLDEICSYCERGVQSCYAENAFNDVSDRCNIYPLDVKDALCAEIDNPEDLENVCNKLREIENRIVYLCFATDYIHGGHITLIKKAQKLGKVVVGVLTDEAVAGYKRAPLLPFIERKILFENIKGIDRVVEQKTLSYAENLRTLRPAYVIHGDDWQEGIQQPIREEVISLLKEIGGELIEFPYTKNEYYEALEKQLKAI